MPDAQCTHSLACEIDKAHERSHHRFTGFDPAFPAQWFYGLLRALPGDQALLSPSPALLPAGLTPALGRQNHTTSPYASASFVRLAIARLTPQRPPHPAPRFVTLRNARLWDRTSGVMEVIWVKREAKYFCNRLLPKRWCIRPLPATSGSSFASSRGGRAPGERSIHTVMADSRCRSPRSRVHED